MEEYGYVLDFLPLGKPDDLRREPLAYLVGEKFFTLLEVVIKRNEKVEVGERLYIGPILSQRAKVERVKGKVDYDSLSSSAKSEMSRVLAKIVMVKEKVFIEFINRCGPITIRQHQLELLPGIGKKHLVDILAEREKAPFTSFKDLTDRVPHLIDPVRIIADRIQLEMKGGERYYLFTRPPHEQK
jgi:putative nucleotide binding protein